MEKLFHSTFNYRLIYILAVPGEEHKGMLKIGKASIDTDLPIEKLQPNCKELNKAAHERIKEYTNTIAIEYSLLYTELALYSDNNGTLKAFYDSDVHDVLKRSGIKKHCFEHSTANEWFECDLETAKKAITAVKERRKALQGHEITQEQTPIIFRPEQKSAIKLAISRYDAGSHAVLWNAKMRFGKTLSALQVVKEKQFQKTLIFTHRPTVDDNWFEDFGKIFYEQNSNYEYGSKKKGNTISQLLKGNKNFVYFASIQDLRGGKEVGGKFDKNDEIFKTEWNFVIIDEAHEGTQTEKGQRVIDAFKKGHTYFLHLSGTPFNLLESQQFSNDDIYTWDYVMEQQAKLDWTRNHYLDANPYEDLPTLNIYTYDLGSIVNDVRYVDVEGKAFNFREFFRTWTGDPKDDHMLIPNGTNIGDFVHEKDVSAFLNLLCKEDEQSLYPFSCKEYQDQLRHSLWILPSVAACRAMSKLLEKHRIFQHFKRANVAGEGDLEIPSEAATTLVEKAIGNHPEESYSITLTVAAGRMTTGVTVKPWTAVFYLAGAYNTKASTYMQTIFRVQTPANIGGRIKEQCYVFDFAPDRTLSVLSDAAKVTTKPGQTTEGERKHLGDFLNFCPVISINGSRMDKFDTDKMLQQLKAVYISRVVRNGFDDKRIYNDLFLSQLSPEDLQELDDLQQIVKASKPTKNTNPIDITEQGLTNEEREEIERIKKKKNEERSEEEKQRLKEAAEKQKQRDNAINTLRAISIRIPMMVYGAKIPFDEDVTIDNFTSLVDDESWEEFMPKGINKTKFNSLKRFYDKDIFTAAGRQIRDLAHTADEYEPLERISKIIGIFDTFKNPDKETVLTPWRVVNMHLSDTLGGYDFYDTSHNNILDEPRFVDRDEVTQQTLANTKAHILEINSKSGLYPLYVTYSIYRKRCELNKDELTLKKKKDLWNQTVRENVFVVCATEMAKRITRRTLLGYDDQAKANIRHFDNLINQIKEKQVRFIQKMHDGKNYWKVNNEINMKIDAIVGNPPYQELDGGNNASAMPVYQHFINVSRQVCPRYISMIMPSRWCVSGRGLDAFRESMLNDTHFSKMFDFRNGGDCFPGIRIGGGVCYILWDDKYNDTKFEITNMPQTVPSQFRPKKEFGLDFLVRDNIARSIIYKVEAIGEPKMSTLSFSQKPFGFRTNFMGFRDHGEIKIYTKKDKTGFGYVSRNEVSKNAKYIDEWKVVTSRSTSVPEEDNGQVLREVQTFISEPGSVVTESYVVVASFNDKILANNCMSYLKTKFFRILCQVTIVSPDVSARTFDLVPIQDFSKPWTDEELYAKYHLDDKEIKFIESMIKPME